MQNYDIQSKSANGAFNGAQDPPPAAAPNTESLAAAAIRYHGAGLRVIPFWNKEGGKKDFPIGYAKYRDSQTADEVCNLFSKICDGIAILTGLDGIEALDFDLKHDEQKTIYQEFSDLCREYEPAAAALKKVVIVYTKSGGYHLIYKAQNIEGNQKLTHREGENQAIIETRGKGGILFVAPTPGYALEQGDYTNIQELTNDERDTLVKVARLLSHREKVEGVGEKPWDAFNSNHNVYDMITGAGWTELYRKSVPNKPGEIIYLNRPGAKNTKGVDASIVTTKGGEQRFYPFTTSTNYQSEKCYSPFGIYVVEEHHGDVKAATAELRKQGYGSPPESNKPAAGDGGAPGENSAPNDPGPPAKTNKPTIQDKLLNSYNRIIKAAGQDIIWTPAWVSFDEAPIFSKGTINVIQGKAGVHKSRLAETFCALLLASLSDSNRDFLGFTKYKLGAGFCVGYIDTERNTLEHFPAAVQRIRERAGLDRKTDNGRFFPVSIKDIDRKDRLDAVKAWIEYIRTEMAAQNWNLFVVLDVVTDCVASFNRDDESLALFDYLGRLCEDFGVTFLLVLHENPFSEKARGHTGTEAMNKADTQIQIGYDSGTGEETDLIKVRFLKTRNSARPKPFFLQYSKEQNGLVVADQDDVSAHLDSKRKNKDEGLLIDKLMDIFDTYEKISQKEMIENLQELGWSDNTIKSKLEGIIKNKAPIQNKTGLRCKLSKEAQPGKPTFYFLEPMEVEDKPNLGQAPDELEDPPF